MTLILTNEDIEQVLTMEDLVPALEDAYIELVDRAAVADAAEANAEAAAE